MLNFHRVGHNAPTDLKPFLGRRSRKVGQLLGDTLQIDTSILVCRCDVCVKCESCEKRVGQKFQLTLGRIFLGTNYPKFFTVDSKPLKPSNIWQNLVGLGSVAFSPMWLAR